MNDTIIALAEKHRALFEKKRRGCKQVDYVLETAPNIGAHRLKILFEIFPELVPANEVLVLVFPTRFRRNTYTEDIVPFKQAFPGYSQKGVGKMPDFVFEDLTGFFLTESGVSAFTALHERGKIHLAEHIPYEKIGIKRLTGPDGETDIFLYEPEGDCNAVAHILGPNPEFTEKFFTDLFALLQGNESPSRQ